MFYCETLTPAWAKISLLEGSAKALDCTGGTLSAAPPAVQGFVAHISERIVAEAKALLKHTDWNISEIAYALGFDYPTYFNNFFKEHSGATPSSYRLSEV